MNLRAAYCKVEIAYIIPVSRDGCKRGAFLGNRHKKEINLKEEGQTEGITIRVDKNMLQALKKEAREKQVSTNTLISQLFGEHLKWHSIAPKAGFSVVRRATLLSLLEKISEEEAASMSRSIGTREFKDLVLLLRHEYNLQSTMEVLETWMHVSGNFYTHKSKFGKHSLAIQHSLGKRWSIFLSELYKAVLEEFGKPNAKVNLTENTVHINFDEA